MNVMGIIFANDGTLSELTTKRTMASLPFGGRYRQIDFALSNLAAAGIHHIGVISRHHFQSLMYHVGGGEEWGLELEEGGLEYLTPYSMSATDTYRGKLDSLHSVMGFLEYGGDEEYVVMTDSAILSNIDLEHVLKTHIESGRDITVVCDHKCTENPAVRAIIRAENKVDTSCPTVKFNLNPGKVFLFDPQTGKRL